MFCKNRGKEIDDKAVICPNCGVPTDNAATNTTGTNPADAPNSGFAVLSFLFPLIGLILYLVWKDRSPLKAKSYEKGALIGVIAIVGTIFLILLWTILFFVGISAFSF